MYIQWDMVKTTQFSLRLDTELLRRIDVVAKREYKTRTELIKDAVCEYLESVRDEKRASFFSKLFLR